MEDDEAEADGIEAAEAVAVEVESSGLWNAELELCVETVVVGNVKLLLFVSL